MGLLIHKENIFFIFELSPVKLFEPTATENIGRYWVNKAVADIIVVSEVRSPPCRLLGLIHSQGGVLGQKVIYLGSPQYTACTLIFHEWY